MPALTYCQFVTSKYTASAMLQRYYPNAEVYVEQYVANHSFTPWLESLRGQTLSLELVKDIAITYMTRVERRPDEIPGEFCLIARQFEIELPKEPGLFCGTYWEEFAADLAKNREEQPKNLDMIV